MNIIECPRDAMQGIKTFIPTSEKISYLNQLLDVGFETLDCGSFVSPRVIPQMADTKEVLCELKKTNTQLSVIVANESGAKRAMFHDAISLLGFPFSMSETFQQRNTNKSKKEAFETIKNIQTEIPKDSKKLLIYFSMAFGNPYHDVWSIDDIKHWAESCAKLGITTINLSDTVGVATLQTIELLFSELTQEFPEITFGAHLHTMYDEWKPKIELAYDLGCRRFDSAIKGFGGCPMAKDTLVGNMPTEKLLTFAQERKIETNINMLAFETAYNTAKNIFETYH